MPSTSRRRTRERRLSISGPRPPQAPPLDEAPPLDQAQPPSTQAPPPQSRLPGPFPDAAGLWLQSKDLQSRTTPPTLAPPLDPARAPPLARPSWKPCRAPRPQGPCPQTPYELRLPRPHAPPTSRRLRPGPCPLVLRGAPLPSNPGPCCVPSLAARVNYRPLSLQPRPMLRPSPLPSPPAAVPRHGPGIRALNSAGSASCPCSSLILAPLHHRSSPPRPPPLPFPSGHACRLPGPSPLPWPRPASGLCLRPAANRAHMEPSSLSPSLSPRGRIQDAPAQDAAPPAPGCPCSDRSEAGAVPSTDTLP